MLIYILIVVLQFIIDSALQKVCEYNDVGWKEISCTRDLERGAAYHESVVNHVEYVGLS